MPHRNQQLTCCALPAIQSNNYSHISRSMATRYLFQESMTFGMFITILSSVLFRFCVLMKYIALLYRVIQKKLDSK